VSGPTSANLRAALLLHVGVTNDRAPALKSCAQSISDIALARTTYRRNVICPVLLLSGWMIGNDVKSRCESVNQVKSIGRMIDK